MALRANQKKTTRRKLIETALELSAAEGFASLSIREVAKNSGITPAAFYRHFRDLEELGLALIDEVGVTLRQLIRDARRKFDRKSETVRPSIETFLAYIIENPNHFRLMLGERQGSSSEFRKAIHSELDLFIGELTEDLERGALLVSKPIEAALAAEVIVAVVFTVGAEALELPKHRRTELGERLIREVKMILRGARIRKAHGVINSCD